MKKDWILALAVTAVAAAVTLLAVRWFAPQLLGIKADMQVVRVSEQVVPFFENVFRREDYQSREFILKDPYTRVRARPLYNDLEQLGPNDILGFRNRAVPNVTDVVFIGDSQIYGNNVRFEETIPSQLRRMVRKGTPTVYNMAVGGWGAVQYLNMAQYATVLQPRVIVVAFYSGNDPFESFLMAYSSDQWKNLRPNQTLSERDVPPSPGYPPPDNELWKVTFKNKRTVTFSPNHRYASNRRDYPAVEAGYGIMREAARRIVYAGRATGTKVVLTIIPTKELVFLERIQKEKIGLHPDYDRLVYSERVNIDELGRAFGDLEGATYVDVIKPLQDAAMRESTLLYPDDADGHPLSDGNGIIASALAGAVDRLLPQSPRGLVALDLGSGRQSILLVREEGYRGFASVELVKANGWTLEGIPLVTRRALEGLPNRGLITEAAPGKFGPRAIR